MANESDYVVKNAKLVLGHLTDIVKKKSILTAHFGVDNASFLTTIVNIDPKKNLLLLDYGPKDYLNEQLLNAEKVLFRTEVDGIKASFVVNQIKPAKFEGSQVFSMPIPGAIFWMQRRQYYRVKIPITHNVTISLSLKNPADDTVELIKYKLLDISASGFAFVNERRVFHDQLLPTEQVWENCTLTLPDGHQGKVSFIIKNNGELRSGNAPVPLQRVGCHFVDLPANLQTPIQHYMQELEIQLRNFGK